jgi:hypothetical protein
MPFRDLNNMETHDGTNQKISFGGPYELRVMLNGEDLYRGEVGKAHDLHISYVPTGETEDA